MYVYTCLSISIIGTVLWNDNTSNDWEDDVHASVGMALFI